jgi:hypothetical protein
LKRIKTAIGSYWKELTWIWVLRHVGLGLAPLPLGACARFGIDGALLACEFDVSSVEPVPLGGSSRTMQIG